MSLRLTPALITCLALALTHPLRAADPTLTQRAEQVAADLPWYDTNAVLSDAVRTWGPTPEKIFDPVARLQPPPLPAATAENESKTATTPPRWTPDEIRPLLKNDNPRVRTLGLMLLFELTRADLLPDIALLTKDNALTFPTPGFLSNRADPWPMEKTTVADYARAMISAYVLRSAALHHLRSLNTPPDELAIQLRAYAATRDPQMCTPALLAAHNRVRGNNAASKDRPERLAAFLQKINALPMPRRFFVSFAVQRESMDTYFSPELMLALARSLTRESRLAIINGDPESTGDPDLTPDTGAAFLLAHAADLFFAKDADLMLSLADHYDKKASSTPTSLGYSKSQCAIAAAMLRPDNADEILAIAMAKSADRLGNGERTALALALAQYGSDRGLADAVDWFFKDPPQRGAFGFGREMFLTKLRAADTVRYRKAVEQIIRDPRLDTLGPASTRLLLQTVQVYLGKPLIDEEQLRDSMGIDESQRDRKFTPLPQWHQTLRTTLKEWSE